MSSLAVSTWCDVGLELSSLHCWQKCPQGERNCDVGSSDDDFKHEAWAHLSGILQQGSQRRQGDGTLHESEKRGKVGPVEGWVKSSQSKAACRGRWWWRCWWRQGPHCALLHGMWTPARRDRSVSLSPRTYRAVDVRQLGVGEPEGKRRRNAVKTTRGGLMRGRWWKGYGDFTDTGSATKNSQESVLIERRPRLIWVAAVLAALMLGYLNSQHYIFNGDQVGQRTNNRNKWGRFVEERRRYARFATEGRSMVMHFSLSNSGRMSETRTAAEPDFSEDGWAHAGWCLLLESQFREVTVKGTAFKGDARCTAGLVHSLINVIFSA